jgi:hypothetical protein
MRSLKRFKRKYPKRHKGINISMKIYELKSIAPSENTQAGNFLPADNNILKKL